MVTTDRRYQMTRLGSGDYLLPSNDGAILWRIARYREDGSAHRDDGTPVLGTFWGVWRYQRSLTGLLDPDEWSDWAMWSQGLRTRTEAIREALRMT